MATKAFIRAKLPSSRRDETGQTLTRAATYSLIPQEEMKQLLLYKEQCAEAAKRGTTQPLPPTSVYGLPQDFYTYLALSTQPMQHSESAALRNRLNAYTAHNINGKADLWITISPRDDLSDRIMSMALGSRNEQIHLIKMPPDDLRYRTLSDHPVAAALHFERILDIIIKIRISSYSNRSCNHGRSHGSFSSPR